MDRQVKEKRGFPRAKASVPLEISGKDLTIVTETKNISRSGAYCSVEHPIMPMSKVKIALVVPVFSGQRTVAKKMKCNGVVIRSEPPSRRERPPRFNIAVYFTDLSRKDVDSIGKYVNFQLYKARSSAVSN